MKKFLIGFALLSALGTQLCSSALAENQTVFCLPKNGRGNVVARINTCNKTEKAVSIFVKGDTGPKGPQGDRGLQGPQGSKGDTGTGVGDSLPSGLTVRGVIGVGPVFVATSNQQGYDAFASFPAPMSQPISYKKIVIASLDSQNCTGKCTNFMKDREGVCKGSTSNPTAPAGYVCIYPLQAANIFTQIIANRGIDAQFGFSIEVGSTDANQQSYFYAVWAATAS